MMKRSVVTCVALAACAILPAAAQSATIFQSDFANGLSGFATTGSAGLRTSNGISFLGGLTQGSSGSIALNIAGYTGVTVSFDLYAIQSLDGDGPSGGGPDPFLVAQDAATIVNYTFANYGGAASQSYPTAGSAPRTGAYTSNLLGYGSGDFGDYEYHIAPVSLATVNGTTTLTFTGNSNQTEGDESYGINNVVVSGTPATIPAAVPEPASWAMMVGGFGLVGGAMRGRRKGTARLA